MIAAADQVDAGLRVFADPAILVGARAIAVGDEAALLPAEAASFTHATAVVRRRSGAARIVARQLLRRLGSLEAGIPRGPGGAPIWPDGAVGSLAHCDRLAVAAVARHRDALSLGVDVEPAEPLGTDLAALIATPAERRRHDCAGLDGRRLVVAKEAAYKAAYALDRRFRDWQDIEIDLAMGAAHLVCGRTVPFEIATVDGHLLALARIPA